MPHRIITHLATHPDLQGRHPLLVAVSGGPDSLVLLHALCQTAFAAHLHVYHLDHGLRGAESAADAAFVQATANALGIPVHLEHADIPCEAPQHRNLSEAARIVRYHRLSHYAHTIGAAAVLVAHTRDDQAETVLMRLLRGSGLRGLAAMVAHTPWQQWAAPHHHAADGPPLLRPLLDIDRAAITAYVAQNDLHPRHDPSNTKSSSFRVRVRTQYLPALRQEQPQLNERLARTAHHLRLADDYIERSLDQHWEALITASPHGVQIDHAAFAALHPALQNAALRRVLLHCTGSLRDFHDTHIDTLRSAILAQSHLSQPLPQRITLHWHTGSPVIERQQHVPAAFALPAPTALPTPGSVPLQRTTLHSAFVPVGTASMPLAVCIDPQPHYTLRQRRPGDGMGIGHGRHRRVQDVMVDAKIPAHQRATWPLLCDGDTVVWVVGVRLDPAYHREGGPALRCWVE